MELLHLIQSSKPTSKELTEQLETITTLLFRKLVEQKNRAEGAFWLVTCVDKEGDHEVTTTYTKEHAEQLIALVKDMDPVVSATMYSCNCAHMKPVLVEGAGFDKSKEVKDEDEEEEEEEINKSDSDDEEVPKLEETEELQIGRC